MTNTAPEIEKCKVCGSMPVLIVPEYKGLYDDMPAMFQPIGPRSSSENYLRKSFEISNPAYFKCETCEAIARAKGFPAAVAEWNEKQRKLKEGSGGE